MFLVKLFSILLVLSLVCSDNLKNKNRMIFDYDLYENVLDPELCNEELEFLFNNNLAMLPFYDSGVRLPSGILTGSLSHWGEYKQCLGIRQTADNSVIEGKYCSISIPINGVSINLPDLPTLPEISWPINLDENTVTKLKSYERLKNKIQLLPRLLESYSLPEGDFSDLALTVAVCIPKTCSTAQRFDPVLNNQSIISAQFTENFCRLPNDKPFTPADYTGIVIFSFIGLLTLLSSLYDLYQTFVLEKGPKEKNTLLTSFSVYTNTRRLLTFHSPPGALHCLDGIRAVAMLWVIVGHTFVMANPSISNVLDSLNWISSFSSVWLLSAPITVDTFFMMSGLLIVYTTVGKFTRGKLLKNLHLFYLLRYIRLFPILGAAVLLQASILHHISDGPYWDNMAIQVQGCRDNWWYNLLFVQNYFIDNGVCLSHTWYLAVDMHLHWISPLILFWLFGGKRTAWIALTAGLLVSLITASVYVYINNFQSTFSLTLSIEELLRYMKWYYLNTITRASPFFVGMIFGYILHIYRDRKVKLSPVSVLLFWLLAIAASSFAIFITHPINTPDYDNQMLDNFINSFMRPLWAAALGWLVFACVHGYGGPVNWFLSLSMWKLPARLSYAMYIFHMSLIYLVHGTLKSPIYFTVSGMLYRFFGDLMATLIVSFIMTLLIDSPFSTLQKLLIGGGQKRTKSPLPIVKEPENLPEQDFENKTRI